MISMDCLNKNFLVTNSGNLRRQRGCWHWVMSKWFTLLVLTLNKRKWLVTSGRDLNLLHEDHLCIFSHLKHPILLFSSTDIVISMYRAIKIILRLSNTTTTTTSQTATTQAATTTETLKWTSWCDEYLADHDTTRVSDFRGFHLHSEFFT